MFLTAASIIFIQPRGLAAKHSRLQFNLNNRWGMSWLFGERKVEIPELTTKCR